jgi:hypothetical protein
VRTWVRGRCVYDQDGGVHQRPARVVAPS